jgi:methylamine utilization protein MauE
MTGRKIFRSVVHLCRFGLAALFLFTAGAKLWILREFVGKVGELLASMKFNYERWQWPATIAVISIEVVVAILLLVPRTVRWGAAAAGLLLMAFSAFALYYTYGLHGEALECGCFGNIIGSQLGVKTALRNLALLVPALVVLFGWRVRSPSASEGAFSATSPP